VSCFRAPPSIEASNDLPGYIQGLVLTATALNVNNKQTLVMPSTEGQKNEEAGSNYL
jgi:hypothetical protein